MEKEMLKVITDYVKNQQETYNLLNIVMGL